MPLSCPALNPAEEDPLSSGGERGRILEHLTGGGIPDHRAGRHFDNQLLSVLAVLLLPSSRLTVPGSVDRPAPQMHEGFQIGTYNEDDISPFASIASVGTAPGDILLPPERDTTIPPLPEETSIHLIN